MAEASATAYATAISDACGTSTSAENIAVKTALAQAAASVSASVEATGGNADSTAQSVAEDIKPVIATATSKALARCACGADGNQAGVQTDAQAQVGGPVPPKASQPPGSASSGVQFNEFPSKPMDFGDDILDFGDIPEFSFGNL